MSSLWIFCVVLFTFFIGYRFYADKFLKLFEINPGKSTPAHDKFDGIDFVPARHPLILFGHHFASIAGAGPIIGPVVALVAWGWLGVLLWIVFGTIFIGGIHDLGALLVSVKSNGNSIAQISEDVISKRARIIFSIFIWIALVLVVAVFVHVCANTFVAEPKIVLPSLGLIPLAVLIGFLMYKYKANLLLVTLLAFACLGFMIFFGQFLPIRSSHMFWSILLLVYAYIASVIPVNILLQPRDYVASYLLFLGVLGGMISIFIAPPQFTSLAFTKFNTASGPLWPMLGVTVACGAISGFHSLISSGTTSKQISSERHAKAIGYGSMVLEGVVAFIAVVAIAAGFSRSENLGLLLKDLGPVALFGRGYGNITKVIFGGFGGFIAITILNAFILTTLDSATRITRYLTDELFGIKNRFLATAIVIASAGILVFSGQWSRLWPAFGASNQLVAALALIVISSYLLMKKKRTRYSIIPAVFMVVTTVAALLYQCLNYIKNGDYLLLAISVFLIGLAVFMIVEFVNKFVKRRFHA